MCCDKKKKEDLGNIYMELFTHRTVGEQELGAVLWVPALTGETLSVINGRPCGLCCCVGLNS